MRMNILRAMALAFFVPMLTLAGCAGVNKATGVDLVVPVSADYSVEQNVYAGLRAYAETSEVVANIIEDPTTPDGVKTILATALLNTEGPAKALTDAWKEYSRIQADIDVRVKSGQNVPEALLLSAAEAYFTAKELWREHEGAITSFPGVVRAVQSQK